MKTLKQLFKKDKNLFKWRHFSKEIILLNLKWYLSYQLSYRNLKEMRHIESEAGEGFITYHPANDD